MNIFICIYIYLQLQLQRKGSMHGFNYGLPALGYI